MNSSVILNKLIEHDNQFGQVDKRFEQVDKRFDEVDKRFEQVDKRFEQVDKRFDVVEHRLDNHDKQFDIVVKKLFEHDVRFDTLEQSLRGEIHELRDTMQNNYDEMITILRRLDQERIFTTEWLKRVDAQCNQNTKDISEIKQRLS